MHFFQTLLSIPAEGVFISLVVILILLVLVLLAIIYSMARRNIRLVDDNRDITRDAIKGFQDVINALNAIREQLQIGDNALMGKVNDTQKVLDDARKTIIEHLQYLRDRSR